MILWPGVEKKDCLGINAIKGTLVPGAMIYRNDLP